LLALDSWQGAYKLPEKLTKRAGESAAWGNLAVPNPQEVFKNFAPMQAAV
jgi:hypothetical protein